MSKYQIQLIQSALKIFFNSKWHPKDFLTEDDVRCRLFCLLQDKLKETDGISVHSEVRWYGDRMSLNENKLKYRSDIVIIPHNDLIISEDNIFKLPSKGYVFNKYHAIIEIKLRRPNNRNSDKKYDEIIKSDLKKLIEIRNKTTGGGVTDKKYFVLVFDKKRNRKLLMDIDAGCESIEWITWE